MKGNTLLCNSANTLVYCSENIKSLSENAIKFVANKLENFLRNSSSDPRYLFNAENLF